MAAVERADLAGWLVRCSPTRTDLAALSDPSRGPVRTWCVARNYRSALMAPGDPIVLWVTGRDRSFVRGVWGVGRVTAPAASTAEDPQLRIGIDLPIGPRCLATDAQLRAVGLDDLEVQRQPQGSNPSWISREQWGRLELVAAGAPGWVEGPTERT